MIPTLHPATPGDGDRAEALEFEGREEFRAWLDGLLEDYADDAQWSAPRRGLRCTTRVELAERLHSEWHAMDTPRVCVLRRTATGARRFHEYTVRFRMLEPGIEGVRFPAGADVELERLRICSHDETGRIVDETCIETWTWLSAPTVSGSPER